jgi:hypothetical protein
MEATNLRYILTRAVMVILLIVAIIYGIGFLKKKQRKDAITDELKSLCSDSSFFRQFYAADAQRSLVKAVGLIAEANQLGMDPDGAIDVGLGVEKKYFVMEKEDQAPPLRHQIIRSCLRSNYENFRKLGYTQDFHTLQSLREGELPPVRNGPLAGSRAEVGTIIDAALSPGLDRVIANLEIRPVKEAATPMTDVEIAAAKRLASDLRTAGVIEETAEVRIIGALTARSAPESPEVPEE